MTSREPLLQRNAPRREQSPEDIQDLGHFAFDDASSQFDVPEGYERETPWNVARFWQEQLKASGRWSEDWADGSKGIRTGLRTARKLLSQYKYIDILRAIRWWSGPSGLKPGRSFRLEWLLKKTNGQTNLDLFFTRAYEKRRDS